MTAITEKASSALADHNYVDRARPTTVTLLLIEERLLSTNINELTMSSTAMDFYDRVEALVGTGLSPVDRDNLTPIVVYGNSSTWQLFVYWQSSRTYTTEVCQSVHTSGDA